MQFIEVGRNESRNIKVRKRQYGNRLFAAEDETGRLRMDADGVRKHMDSDDDRDGNIDSNGGHRRGRVCAGLGFGFLSSAMRCGVHVMDKQST